MAHQLNLIKLMSNKIKIIAEAGCNHNGSITNAKKLIDIAKAANADYVKFQFYNADSLLIPSLKKAKYQDRKTSKNISQYERLKKVQLSEKQIIQLNNYSKKNKIKFSGSFFDIESLKILKLIKTDFIKISSSEINNLELLKEIGKNRKKVILSTGMATMAEIKEAVNVLDLPEEKLILMHCISSYPTSFKDTNLGFIKVLKDNFKNKIGFSDHTESFYASLIAISLGAEIIEKHFTIDKRMSGGDHKFALNPSELKLFVKLIKETEISINQSNLNKRPQKEKEIMKISRKSICLLKDLKKGDKLQEKYLSIKRPGTGIQPKFKKNIIGKKILINLKKDSVLQWKHIKK